MRRNIFDSVPGIILADSDHLRHNDFIESLDGDRNVRKSNCMHELTSWH